MLLVVENCVVHCPFAKPYFDLKQDLLCEVCINVKPILLCFHIWFLCYVWKVDFVILDWHRTLTIMTCTRIILHMQCFFPTMFSHYVTLKVNCKTLVEHARCKIRWITFCVTLQVYIECHALTCHKIIIMSNFPLN